MRNCGAPNWMMKLEDEGNADHVNITRQRLKKLMRAREP